MSFEVGAFEASFSIKRREKTKTPCYAFEASKYNYLHFQDEANNKEIHYLNMAISDTNGFDTFKIKKTIAGREAAQIVGNNSLLTREDPKGLITYEDIQVKTVRLDTFIDYNGLSNNDFSAWIDAEGASKMVLNGMIGCLQNCRIIFIEVETKAFWVDQWLFPQVHNFMSEHGFEAVARDFEYDSQFNLIYLDSNLSFHPSVIEAIGRFYDPRQDRS